MKDDELGPIGLGMVGWEPEGNPVKNRFAFAVMRSGR